MGIFHCRSCFKDHTIDTTLKYENNESIKKNVEELVQNEVKLSIKNISVKKEIISEISNEEKNVKLEPTIKLPQESKEFNTLNLTGKEKGKIEKEEDIKALNSYQVLEQLKENQNCLYKLPCVYFENGISYEGEWLEFKRHGQGIQKFPCGIIYQGQWNQDKAHGQGILLHPNGDKYSGQWFEDKAEGYGVYKFDNGRVFKGFFKNSLFDGNGIESHGDGSVYNGQFKSGNLFYYFTLQVKEMGKGN